MGPGVHSAEGGGSPTIPGMLDQIVADTQVRLETLRSDASGIRRNALGSELAPSLLEALSAPGLSVIAEVKRRSPSRGDLAPELDPSLQSKRYVEGGAAAISVLTEPVHFHGSNSDLTSVRRAVDVPVLRKDFTLDPLQIWEARAIGASAVLLIAAILDDQTMNTLLMTAVEAGLDAVVEVHSVDEAERVLALNPTIVGVNNRDLSTFDVDLATAEKIAPMLIDVPVTIGESGIHSAEDAHRMFEAGYDAVLVGESLVRSDDPAELIRAFRGAS